MRMLSRSKCLRSGGMILLVILCAATLFVALPLVACDGSKGVSVEKEIQNKNMAASLAASPPYQYQYFLTAEAINEYCKRTDVPSKLWYVYLYAPMGQELGFFIADRIPTSINVARTAPDRIVDRNDGDVVVRAPALDGVYYAGDIDMAYIFDVESDAMICYYNIPAIVSDKPLSLNMPQRNVILDES